MVSISACHAEDPGSIPGGGVFLSLAHDVHEFAISMMSGVCLGKVSSACIAERNGHVIEHHDRPV